MRHAVRLGLSSRVIRATRTGWGTLNPSQSTPIASDSARSTAAQLFPDLGFAAKKPLAPRSITPSTSQLIFSGTELMKSGASTNNFCPGAIAGFQLCAFDLSKDIFDRMGLKEVAHIAVLLQAGQMDDLHSACISRDRCRYLLAVLTPNLVVVGQPRGVNQAPPTKAGGHALLKPSSRMPPNSEVRREYWRKKEAALALSLRMIPARGLVPRLLSSRKDGGVFALELGKDALGCWFLHGCR